MAIPRWLKIIVVILVALLVAGAACWHYGLGWARRELLAALGPGSSLGALKVGWQGVELKDLRLPANADAWPVAEAFRAERIVVDLDWLEVLRGRPHLRQVMVFSPYLSLVHDASGLRLPPGVAGNRTNQKHAARFSPNTHASTLYPEYAIVPAAFFDSRPAKANAAFPFVIDRLEIVSGAVEMFTTTLRQTPLRLRLEKVAASASGIGSNEGIALDVNGRLKGVQRDGALSLKGTLKNPPQTGDLALTLTDVDLPPLQALFLSPTDADLAQGTLHVETHLQIVQGHLHAPVRVRFAQLTLAANGPRFMDLPREVAQRLLQHEQGRIELNFVLEGDLADPNYRVGAQLQQRLMRAFSGTLQRKVRDNAENLARESPTQASELLPLLER